MDSEIETILSEVRRLSSLSEDALKVSTRESAESTLRIRYCPSDNDDDTERKSLILKSSSKLKGGIFFL